MDTIEYNKKEYTIERGENVTIHAIFTRHGEKIHDPDNPETELTPEGERKSFEFGRGREKKDMIKPYTSDTMRTRRTAESAIAGSPTEKKGRMRNREGLAFVYDEKGRFLKDILKMRKDILGEDYESLRDDEKQKRLQAATAKQAEYYLSFGDKRPDPNTYSPVETASGIARIVDRYIAMAGKLQSGSTIDLVNSTHDLNVAAFLKEVIVREVGREKVKGFQSIEEIGGPIGYNEHFEIIIKRKDKNNTSVKMLFRGQEYEIDGGRVKELVEVAKKLEEKKL